MSKSLPVPDPLLLGAPGLRIESATGPEGLATALYSPCDRYRYRVSRVWDDRLPRVCFLLLNPSTATAFQLDPTLRRVYRYARDWGMGSFEVTNIFAYRSTDPSFLYRVDDPVGVHNDGAILDAARSATLRVAGWGTHGALQQRGSAVRRLFAEHGLDLSVLRLTTKGHPNHPLYLPASLQPAVWPE